MKMNDSRDCYSKFSGKASDICRQLAFAALAIAWIFKIDTAGSPPKLPSELLAPMALVVLALVMDLMQYTYASAAWGFFNRRMEKKFNDDCEFFAPRWINWPTIVCFWAKLGFVVIAYILLLGFTSAKIFR